MPTVTRDALLRLASSTIVTDSAHPTGTPAPPLPPSGPVAQWLLNSASITGTTVADATGNGNTATVNNGPLTFGPQGANFNGTTQFLANSSLVVNYPELTVSCWFNPDTLSSGGPRLVANSHTDVDVRGFQLSLNASSAGFSVGNGSGYAEAGWSQSFSSARWYNFVGVYDGASVKSYLQGLQTASAMLSGNVATGAGPHLSVARNSTYAGDYFDGAIYDVRIYNRALSAAEVLALYNAMPVAPIAITLSPTSVTLPEGSPAGTLITTASVTMSNGTTFTGILTSSNAALFGISGLNIVLARTLALGDEGATSTITATQAGFRFSIQLGI
jgi:hypothetical protein